MIIQGGSINFNGFNEQISQYTTKVRCNYFVIIVAIMVNKPTQALSLAPSSCLPSITTTGLILNIIQVLFRKKKKNGLVDNEPKNHLKICKSIGRLKKMLSSIYGKKEYHWPGLNVMVPDKQGTIDNLGVDGKDG